MWHFACLNNAPPFSHLQPLVTPLSLCPCGFDIVDTPPVTEIKQTLSRSFILLHCFTVFTPHFHGNLSFLVSDETSQSEVSALSLLLVLLLTVMFIHVDSAVESTGHALILMILML